MNEPKSDRLPAKFERLLVDWPEKPRSDADFERMARAVEARISRALDGDTAADTAASAPPNDGASEADWLLRAPLPLQPSEPRIVDERGTEPARPTQTEPSFQDIAKAALIAQREAPAPAERPAPARHRLAALTTGGSTAAESSAPSRARSGVIPLPPRPPPQAALLPQTAQLRQPSAVHSAPTLGSTAVCAPALAQSPPAASAPSGPSSSGEQRPAQPGSRLARRAHWFWGALAMAAGAFGLYLHSGADEAAVAQSGASDTAVAQLEAPLAQSAHLADPGAGSTAEQSAAEQATAAQPNRAKAASEPSAVERTQPALAVNDPAEAAPSDVDDLPKLAAASRPSQPKGRSPAAAPAAPPEPASAPPVALQPEAEPPALVPAAAGAGHAQRPSIGAAQGAVGVVLPAARACLAGQTQPSRVDVVFGSDGRVHSVAVDGPARGTPAEPCITNAMRNARVRPFGDETFTVRTTVRP